MTEPPRIEWFPFDYMDEVMPAGRPGADAWIATLDDSAPALANLDEGEAPERGLRDGDLVNFVTCATYAIATLTIAADGSFAVDATMPIEAEHVCALNGYQAETLSDSVAGVVKELIELVEEVHQAAGEYPIAYYTYSAALPHRFDAAQRRFLPVAS